MVVYRFFLNSTIQQKITYEQHVIGKFVALSRITAQGYTTAYLLQEVQNLDLSERKCHTLLQRDPMVSVLDQNLEPRSA